MLQVEQAAACAAPRLVQSCRCQARLIIVGQVRIHQRHSRCTACARPCAAPRMSAPPSAPRAQARPRTAPSAAARRRRVRSSRFSLPTALNAERRAAAQARANQPELTGYHAKRAEFEPEYDADAETLVAELEFAPSEPQVRLQPPTHPHPCRVRV